MRTIQPIKQFLVLFAGLLTLNLATAQTNFELRLAEAEALFEKGEYAQVATQCQAFYAERSPRTKELMLGIKSLTLAGQEDAAMKVVSNGINSGWLDLQSLLTDSSLVRLHPRADWQSEIQRLLQLTNGSNPELRERLITLTDRDQFYRRQMADIARESGWSSPIIREMYELQRSLDSLNLAELKFLIQENGYPGRSIVGNQGSAAIYIIQRADLATQEAYYPMLEEAANNYELMRSEFAILTDKMQMAKELPQLYGTQVIRTEEGMIDFYRIEAREEINTRRREMGLMPIEEYAQRVGIRWNHE